MKFYFHGSVGARICYEEGGPNAPKERKTEIRRVENPDDEWESVGDGVTIMYFSYCKIVVLPKEKMWAKFKELEAAASKIKKYKDMPGGLDLIVKRTFNKVFDYEDSVPASDVTPEKAQKFVEFMDEEIKNLK